MKKPFCTTCLLVFLFCFSNFQRAEESGKQYDEFSFPDTLSVEERENKINALYRTLRDTDWDMYPHEFSTPEEKRAYRTQGCRTLIQACQELNALVPEAEIKTWNIYRIGGSYQRLYNDVPESERHALLEELKQQIARYAEKERFKDIVTDIHCSIDVFPFHLEILKPNRQTLKDRSTEEHKQLIHQFYEFLKASELPSKGITMELVDEILYGYICYLEKLAANEPAEKEFVAATLKNYGEILGEKYERGKDMRKIVERLEMTGKTCPWKLPLFGSDEFVDFSQNRGRVSLITYGAVWQPQTLQLQYAHRLWKDKGLDLYQANHTSTDFLLYSIPALGFNTWQTFQKIPEDEPDREDHYFLNRYLGLYEVNDVCILIDRDGTVLDSNLLQKNVIARLEEIFGKAPYNIAEKADAFIESVSQGEFQKLFDNCPPDELPLLLADAALVIYSRAGGDFSRMEKLDELLELAKKVLEKCPSEQGKFLAVNTMTHFITQLPDDLKGKHEKLLTATLQKLESSGHIRCADKIRWALYQNIKFKWDEEVEEFVKFRDEVFQYLLDHPASVIPEDLYSLLSTMAAYGECYLANKPETVRIAAETCLACAKMLSGSENKEIRNHAEFLLTLARRLVLVGKEMPLEGVTLEGMPFNWDAYAGKVVLIDFWATWCGPCIAEIPKVRKHYEKYHEQGFEVIGISTDKDWNALAEFLRKNDLPWICLADQKLEVQGKKTMAATYAVTAIPEVILVGRDGKVVLLNARGAVLDEKLAELFPEGE